MLQGGQRATDDLLGRPGHPLQGHLVGGTVPGAEDK